MGTRLHAFVVFLCVASVAACGGETAAKKNSSTPPSVTESSNAGDPTAPSVTPSEQPAPSAPKGSGAAVKIAFGGDIHYESSLRSELDAASPSGLAGVKPVIDSADITVVNLETALGTGGTKAPKAFNFLAKPTALGVLVNQGVDVIAMANNHALDYGQDGLRQTLGAIDYIKAPVIGIGADEDAAFKPLVVERKGARIAFVNATQVLDANLITAWTATASQGGVASAKRVDRLIQAVKDARDQADTVVVFLHWGTEKQQCPNPAQLELAPKLAEAGADLIVGGHAHRIQGGGYLGKAYVEYGLGNFQFIGGQSEAGNQGGMLSVIATGRNITEPTWHPYRISGGRPTLSQGAQQTADRASWDGLRACAKLSAAPT